MTVNTLPIGAHMSVSGGLWKAFERSQNIGGNAFQIFAKSPRGRFFKSSELPNEIKSIKNIIKSQDTTTVLSDVEKKTLFDNYGQKWALIHSVYLVNLAKPFLEAQKDRDSVIDDFEVARQIGFGAVNIHLGKYGQLQKNQAIQNMIQNVGYILEKVADYDVKFVFENTAGQGSEIGYDFAELGSFYNDLKTNYGKEFIESKVNFCIDTAHLWGAGYDVNDFENVLGEFDKYIGLDKIAFLHLNDSKALKGSKLDRHANLGMGFIGLKGLSKVIKWAYLNQKPIILETIDETLWAQEIQIIKGIIDGSFDETQITDFHKKHYQTQVLKKFETNQSQSLF